MEFHRGRRRRDEDPRWSREVGSASAHGARRDAQGDGREPVGLIIAGQGKNDVYTPFDPSTIT